MANKNFRCFPVGKLPIQALRRLLELNRIVDPRVLAGPGIGEDAAVIDTGGPRFLIAKSDPITFAVDRKKITATVIGEVTDKRAGRKLLPADGLCNLPLYEQDELTKL